MVADVLRGERLMGRVRLSRQGVPRGHRQPPSERYEAHVIRRGPDECWAWKGSVSAHGYGRLGGGPVGSPTIYAHVLSWETHAGQKKPGGMEVRHRCDNPPCTNPRHLHLGTHAQNMHDSVVRDRHARGSRNGHAVLTESDVIDIRTLRGMGARGIDLAEAFGVSPPTVSEIVNRLAWRHVS